MDLSPDASQLSSQHTRAVNGGNLDHGPEAMRLPVGPVSSMLDPAAYMANDWYTVSVDGTNPSKSATFTAPAVLVCDPLDGSLAEIVQATNIDPLETVKLTNAAGVREDWTNANFGKWLTPEWLHGLYNTEIQTTWAVKPGGNGDVQPLLIGWWTRFPSALPSTPPASAANRNAQLRSRAFPWIGFCMRLARARFDDQQPFQISFDPSLATNQVLIETQPNLTLEVRAMAGTIDGNAAVTGALEDPARSGLGDWSIRTAHTPALPPPGGAPTWLPLSGLYTWNTDFSGQPNEIDGVEVRLSFRYTGTTSSRLDDIARAANRAPLIGGAILQGHAPITVLATEGAR